MTWRHRATVLLTCLATASAGVALAGPARGENRVTPGNFTGYGFDQCVAPTQAAMDRWLTSSPYWAVGIYISGDSRGCPYQPNLSPTWVSTQLNNGWRLLPLTVGPQAWCTTRETYLEDVRISPNPTTNYLKARQQGRAEAAKTVRAAKALGISTNSTLWYDIEAFDISGTHCRESAISFLSAWTNKMHALGYVSGVYSSAASGIKMLDDANADRPGKYTMPDQVWIADWNGKADIYSAYVRSTSWMPHKRVHQYRGGHNETYGGVTINIDSNFMSLGVGSVAPKVFSLCGGVEIDFLEYYRLERGDAGPRVKALQCLLKRKGTYDGDMTGSFNQRTHQALVNWQTANRMKVDGVASLSTWTAILSQGSQPILKYGSAAHAVRRVQRALNAAVAAQLPITGVYNASTAAAVHRYQDVRGEPRTSVVAANTWAALERGLR
jgi:peptidoglycan hydrolase-like protein with peptidoglycan-binding domain